MQLATDRTMRIRRAALMSAAIAALPSCGFAQFQQIARQNGVFRVQACSTTHTATPSGADFSDSASLSATVGTSGCPCWTGTPGCCSPITGSAAGQMATGLGPSQISIAGSGLVVSNAAAPCTGNFLAESRFYDLITFSVSAPVQVVLTYDMHTHGDQASAQPRFVLDTLPTNLGTIVGSPQGPTQFGWGLNGANQDRSGSICLTLLPGPYRLQANMTASAVGTASATRQQSYSVSVGLAAVTPSTPVAAASSPACAGSPVMFTVSNLPASPTAFAWQWKPNGTGAFSNLTDGVVVDPITGHAITVSGCQTQALSVAGAGISGAEYRCVVTNACGSNLSNAVTLMICPADIDDDGDFDNGHACDGGVDINDLLYFLGAFEAGDLAGDLDDGNGQGIPDGGVDINDLLFFLGHFEAGC